MAANPKTAGRQRSVTCSAPATDTGSQHLYTCGVCKFTQKFPARGAYLCQKCSGGERLQLVSPENPQATLRMLGAPGSLDATEAAAGGLAKAQQSASDVVTADATPVDSRLDDVRRPVGTVPQPLLQVVAPAPNGAQGAGEQSSVLRPVELADELAEAALSEIAHHALMAKRVVDEHVVPNCNDAAQLAALEGALALVGKIGLIADLAIKTITGSPGVFGDASDWMVSGRWSSLLKQLPASERGVRHG